MQICSCSPDQHTPGWPIALRLKSKLLQGPAGSVHSPISPCHSFCCSFKSTHTELYSCCKCPSLDVYMFCFLPETHPLSPLSSTPTAPTIPTLYLDRFSSYLRSQLQCHPFSYPQSGLGMSPFTALIYLPTCPSKLWFLCLPELSVCILSPVPGTRPGKGIGTKEQDGQQVSIHYICHWTWLMQKLSPSA